MKITSFKIISLVVLILAAFLGIKIYQTYKYNYNVKRMEVIESSIKYQAKRCYVESTCKGKIKVQDLYDKGYLKHEFICPSTKEPYDKNCEIEYDENKEEANLLCETEVKSVSIMNQIKMWLH